MLQSNGRTFRTGSFKSREPRTHSAPMCDRARNSKEWITSAIGIYVEQATKHNHGFTGASTGVKRERERERENRFYRRTTKPKNLYCSDVVDTPRQLRSDAVGLVIRNGVLRTRSDHDDPPMMMMMMAGHCYCSDPPRVDKSFRATWSVRECRASPLAPSWFQSTTMTTTAQPGR
jgi:hypothetical protein